VEHEIFRGDTANFRLEVKDRPKGKVNISGWVFVLSAARRRGGEISFTANGIIDDAVNGVVKFELTPAQTANLGKFFYDVQATAPGGKVYTIDTGKSRSSRT